MEYETKFKEMQKYIPFLEKMISRLESTQTGVSNPREAQLTKIKALRNLLLDTNKRMKMENLLKCEQVILNLYSKVEEAKIMSRSPGGNYVQIKKEVIDENVPQEEPVADLQTVREKLKIVSNVKESMRDPTSSAQSPASRDLDRGTNKPTGSSLNPVQIRSEVRVPHLFERRPRRTSKSESQSPPHHRTQTTDLSSRKTKTYTRILKSPECDTKKWKTSSPQKPYDSQDVQLFQRRSPRRTSSNSLSPRKSKKSHKKEKDRSLLRPNVDSPSNCSQADVNITLDVPKESLSSFGASNIFERIMQCNKDDVDIKHLRELRTQIVSELRQTGVNNDISEYILKSYKKKKKKRSRVEEIEEGEIPDSESESVQKIYSNMSIEVKDNNAEEEIDHSSIELSEKIKNLNTSTTTLTEEERRKDSPKIKISLTFSNTNVDQLDTASESAFLPKHTTTFLLDIANDQELKGSGSETSLCPIKSEADTSASFYGDLQIDESVPSEVTPTLENISNKTQTSHSGEIAINQSDIANKLNFKSDIQASATSQKMKNTSTDKETFRTKEITSDTITNASSTNIIGNSKTDLKVQSVQIKPTKPYRSDTNPINVRSTHSTTLKNFADSGEAVSKPKEFYLPLSDVQADKDLTDLLYKDLSPSNSPRNTPSSKEKEDSTQSNKHIIQEPKKSSNSSSTENKANNSASEVFSEIEILKALKSEILAESIHLPKLDGETPSLHQPKISKVVDKTQLEVNQKKRISIENYKKKAPPTQKGIFIRQAEKEQAKLLSRALTPRECERFQMILKGPLDEGMSDEDTQISANTLNKSHDNDMGPESPEEDNFSDEVPGSPIIIPSDPVQSEDRSSLPEHVKKDVDMRIHRSSPQINACPTASPQQKFSKHLNFTSLPNTENKDGHDRSNVILNSPNHHGNPDFSISSKYKGRNPNPLLGHRTEPLLNTPTIPSLLATAVMHPSMTPSRTPAMTPSRAPPITPSRVLMTPSYTPTFDDNLPTRRHVYAPLDLPDPARTPLWDMTSPRIRDDGSSTPIWENDPRSGPMRDMPGTPLWDKVGGRSPIITDSPNEFGFCTPRHDPFNRIGEYNRSFDPLANSSDNCNRNRAPRDPRLRPERRDDTVSHESRTPTFSHGNRSTADTLFDSRNNRESRQYGQPFYEGSHRRFDYDVAMDDNNMNRGRCFNRASSVGRNISSDQIVGHNMSHGPSIARNVGRQPSVGRNVVRESTFGPQMDRERNIEPNIGRESSVGRNIGREPSIGRNIEHEVSVRQRIDEDHSFGRYIDRERSDGRNFVRAQSVGRNLSRAQSVGRNFGRAKSVQRDMGYELDFGWNMGPERSVGRQTGRETSVGRNIRRDTSVGHNINRERSVGRDIECNAGKLNIGSYMARERTVGCNIEREPNMGLNNNRERSVGREFGHEPSRERGTSVGRNLGREQSVGRNMGREQSVGRNMTLEPSAGRNMTCEPSTGRNLGREQSVGRKMGREPSVGRNMGPDPSVGRGANTSRGQSIEHQSNKREKNTNRKDNTSMRRKGYERTDSIEQEESDRNSLRIVGSNNRDPRSRRDLYESTKSHANSSKSSSNNSSPRTGHSKVPNEKYNRLKSGASKRITRIPDYGGRTERKDQNVYENDRKNSIGISYTSDNIAKGKLLSQGYGVKNYKIPKIRRPVEEISKEEINNKADNKTEEKKIPSTSKAQSANERVNTDKDDRTKSIGSNSNRVGSEEKKVRNRPHRRKRIICNPKALERKKNPDVAFIPKDKYSSNTSDSSRSSSSSEFDEIMSKINQHLVDRSSESDDSAKKIPISSKKVHKDKLKVSSTITNTIQTDILSRSPKTNFEPLISIPLSANEKNAYKVNSFDVTLNADDTPQINVEGKSNVTNLTHSITSTSTHTLQISKSDMSATQLLKRDTHSPPMMECTNNSFTPQEDLLHDKLKPVDDEVSTERVDYKINVEKETINNDESKSKVVTGNKKNEMTFESVLPKKIVFGEELTHGETVIGSTVDKTMSHGETKLPRNKENPTETLNDNLHSTIDKPGHSVSVIASTKVSKLCEDINAKSDDEIQLLENDEYVIKAIKENLYSTTVPPNEDVNELLISANNRPTENKTIKHELRRTDINLPIGDSVESSIKNYINPNLIKSPQSMQIAPECEIKGSTNKNTNMVDTKEEAQILITDTSLSERHSSIPDSTMTNDGSEITPDEILPDSTQASEINTDASSVVSSSHDVSKDDEKDLATKNQDKSEQEMEAIKSLGSILSMLQDRTKMKHILTLLNKDHSAETEKFKRRLAKLSEIASDDEEVNAPEEITSNSALLEHNSQCSQDLESNAIASQLGGSVEAVISGISVQSLGNPGLDAALESYQTTKITEPLPIKELDSQTAASEVGGSALGIALENHNNSGVLKNTLSSKKGVTSKSNSATENMLEDAKEDQLNSTEQAVDETEKVIDTNKYQKDAIEKVMNTNIDQMEPKENIMDTNKDQTEVIEKDLNTNKDQIEIIGKVVDSNKDQIGAADIQPDASHTELDVNLLPRNSVKKKKSKSKTLTQLRDKKSIKKNPKKLTKRKIQTSLEEKRITRAESVQKIPRKEKGKSKSKKGELQKLQEDIRDMFISQGVLNATGIRMCRLAKLTDDKSEQPQNHGEDISPKLVEKKIAKNISKKDMSSSIGKDPTPLVVLEKTPVSDSVYEFKLNEDEFIAVAPLPKIRKKPGPKPRSKLNDSSVTAEVPELKKNLSKPGPKSKKRGFKKTEESKDIEDTSVDSLSAEPLETTFDSDDESLSSLVSATSSERVKERKPKLKRKKPMWQHGFIKNKNKKKTNKDIPVKKRPRVPDDTCFIDKKYCFAQNSPKYRCRLCDFEGENIVLHCKEIHPHHEVPLSRINPKTAAAAIEQSLNTDFDKFHKIKNTMVCRFCFQVFEGGNGRKIEKFFWHIVSKHTGEYKYQCSICTEEEECPSSLDIPTPPSEGQQLLLGYICGECHYTQISLNNLKTHVALRHDNEETEVYTINLCDLPPDDKVKASGTNRMKSNKTPENNPSIRQLRSRRDASLSETDLLKSTIHTRISDAIIASQPEKKSTGKIKSKRIGPKFTFEDDYYDENTQSEVFESGSEAIKSEREDTDVPDCENNTDDNLDGSSSRRSSVGSDIRLISENTEFVEYLRRVQIKQEPVEEQHEDILPAIEYEKSPHFMITNSNEGTKSAKLYVCRVKGCGIGYKTSLLIGLKMHVQSKHLGWRDIWDGYCCVCKQVTNETSSRSSRNFSDCLNHMLMNHLDDFPVQKIDGKTSGGTNVTANSPTSADRDEVEYSKPKKYISVKPMTDLIAKSPATNDDQKHTDTETTVPRVQSVASLQSTSEAEDSQPATSLDGAAEPTPTECIPRDARTKEPLTSPVDSLIAIVTEKHSVVLEHMLEASKLTCLFKCAGRYCSFVSRDASNFIVHVSAHLKLSNSNSADVLRCAYCEHTSAGGALLAAHLLSAHGHCRYSCPHCWYLATSPVLVEIHRARAHPAQPAAPPLALNPLNMDESAAGMRGVLQRVEVVPFYSCCMPVTVYGQAKACSFRGYTATKYREHFELRHPAATEFQCFACQDKFPRPSNLIGHLKQHGLGLFQCTFCLYGADTEQEMLEHAACYHPAGRPQAYLRHVFEAKDGNASEKKFKSLPLMRLGQQAHKDITITTPPILEHTDCPNAEAERAHGLQNLILQHQPSSTPAASSERVEESGVLTQKTLPDVPVPQLTKEQNTNKPMQENSAVTPEETVSLVKSEPNDAGESSKRLKENNSRKKNLEEYIICLDSDEEDQKPLMKRPASPKGGRVKVHKTAEALFSSLSKDIDIIDLSDDESTSEVPDMDNSEPVVRYALDKLFKCQKCQETCKNDYYYRQHLTKCYPDPSDHPKCPYCLTTTASRKEIRFHLIQSHGPKKTYRCSICDMSNTQSRKLVQHMHVDHNIDYVTVNLESPSSETANMKYVVQADASTKHKMRARPPSPKTYSKPGPKPRSKQPVKRPADPKPILRYGPEDIDRLPHNPILDNVIQCSRCDFSTKVRSNMIRHLQMHANEQAVPSAAPVNPVPHLESNQMHFDKMTNLAASSNAVRQTERPSMSTANVPSVTPEMAAKYPKYVPDKERNACGAVGCGYISLDESLLKYHWDTLHTDLVHGDGFHCVHCPPNQQVVSPPVTAGRIVAHLKMHGPRLYGCADCGYYNHVLITVEKHTIEKHGVSGKGVTAIRESGETIITPTPVSTAPPSTDPKAAPTMDLKPWQCGVCKFKTMLRPEITEHCSRAHGFKFQFKCTFCPYSGSVQASVTRHQNERHAARSAPDVLQVYYKELSLQVDEEESPLWIRQRKFLDIGDNVDVKPEVSEPSRPPSAASTSTLPTPLDVVNLAIVKSEVEDTPKEMPDTMDTVSARFGAIGDPRGEQYLCPLCKVTTEENKSLFITHLYEELNYRKFSCYLCSYRAFSKQRMQEHILQEHKQTQEPLELPPDIEVEIWLDNLLKHQDNIIAANKAAKNAILNQTQAKPKESPTIKFKPGEGPSTEVLNQLEQMFGSLGTSNDDNFACPKCEFTTADENDITQHLEMELGKIRWACSGCSQKFQHYHVAQQHCSSGNHATFVHVTAVSKDPSQRTLWIDCVIRAQRKTSQTTAPSPSTSHLDRNESVDSLLELDTSNNSLLVVRYEESVPGPQEHEKKIRKQQPTRKRKPTSLREDDSDEEPRLIIADKSPQMHACAHCDYRTNNASVLRTHSLRHFNMRPYTCGYCEYTGYKSSLDKHLKRDHSDLPAKWITNKVPTDTEAIHGALPMPKNTKVWGSKNSLDTPDSSSPLASKPSTSKASASKASASKPSASKPLGSKASAIASSTKTYSKQTTPTEELTFVCLLCEMEIPQHDVGSHHKACHQLDEDEQIVERGKLVLKCGACMSLRADQDSLKKHHEEKHRGSDTSYTLFRAGSEQRDALVCDHCGRMFTFLKDLKCHHFATHSSLQLQYSKKACVASAPGKRKHEEDNTSVKRVAKKSTTKLPFVLKAVARKSTSKLPFNEPEIEEISSDEEEVSHYGTRPAPIEKFSHIQTRMPFFGSMVPVTVQKFSGLINVSPVVTVPDYKKVSKKT